MLTVFLFCYSCSLGPVQTVRSVCDADRFQLAFLNQRHISEAMLNEAITAVVNARIRNWKEQHLFRPDPLFHYRHIDELFTAQIDGR